ncbi:heptosyltransferase-3 [Candidatus Electrothrix aarhusensis]|jgi:lipopolysaccharide heptosyltransferase II|uniref:Heptosyltransferase-3 n=1 Tax=Candidatus Electrothrix aarhusensis TaxID=1859131 RepID=A0A3S3UA73_9BACT|nr:heptosyltransferase-3 [Candidatus Electrothrix aarhusensis]
MYKIINRKKRIATIIADIFGNLLFFPLRLIRKQEAITPDRVKTICIIRTAYIGDVIMTLPILPALHKKYPEAKITFLTSTASAALLRNNKYIDKILTFNPFWFYSGSIKDWFAFISKLRSLRFDLLIETRADIRELALLSFWIPARFKVSYDVGGGGYLLTHRVPYPGLCHKVDYHLQLARYLDCPTEGAKAELFLTAEEEQDIVSILRVQGVTGPFIAVHPGSRLVLKRWFPERFAQVCENLFQQYGLPVVLVGGADESPLAQGIQATLQDQQCQAVLLAGVLNIRQLAALLGRAALFLCNDSAPMHIAAAMKIPTLAIFGPSKSVETAPYSPEGQVVEKDFPCRVSCDESRCCFPEYRSEYHACLQEITVQDVQQAAEKILNRSYQPIPS